MFVFLYLLSFTYNITIPGNKKNRTILCFTYLNKQIINRNSKNLEMEYKQKHVNLFQMSNINRLEMGINS